MNIIKNKIYIDMSKNNFEKIAFFAIESFAKYNRAIEKPYQNIQHIMGDIEVQIP